MAGILYAEIDLKKIPVDVIEEFVRNNGELGAKVKLCIAPLKKIDKFGHTHTVYLYQPKLEVGERGKPTFIGNGRMLRPSYRWQDDAKQNPEPDNEP